MMRPPWDFDYRPVTSITLQEDAELDDWILATENAVDPAELAQIVGAWAPDLRVDPALDWHPLYWTRLRTGRPLNRAHCEQVLRGAGIAVRYIASARSGSQRLPPTLDLDGCLPMRARQWKARRPSTLEEPTSAGRWFVGPTGLDVDRRACGTGAGTRLAVIDNDGGDVDSLDLDNHFLVGIDQVPTGSSHAALLVAWAVRAASRSDGCRSFIGIAPDASPRLYSIPKPGNDVTSLPVAIVRAVADGADVVVCATNVEGQWSPMLDDALELASRLGRGGRGTAMVLPCGRETSSPEGSVHSSLSLGVGDPAADPRVFCVAPSGRDGGWFLWRDRRGRLHPFANRGPALRWLAPGDDVALPFSTHEVLTHAESSGASAMAAGVLLLVLGQNPTLTLSELEDAVTRTTQEVEPEPNAPRRDLADIADVLPIRRDRDGHNAKHGYGRMDARRACLLVSDPVSSVLAAMGEECAAVRWLGLRDEVTGLPAPELRKLAAWSARVVLADVALRHALSMVLRHVRLVAGHAQRVHDQSPGALLRGVTSLLRALPRSRHAGTLDAQTPDLLQHLTERAETAMLDAQATAQAERWLCQMASNLWPDQDRAPLSPTAALLGA